MADEPGSIPPPFERDNVAKGSQRLSGDVIHEQFIAEAAQGDYTSFPSAGTAGTMTMGVMNAPGAGMAMNGGAAGSETSKLSGEDFNLFRGVFNAAVQAYAAVPRRLARRPISNCQK